MTAIDVPDSHTGRHRFRLTQPFGTKGLTASEATVFASIAVCAVMQLWLQFIQQINWDEFFYLSQIYEHQRGNLTRPLQTLHVHLFGWLTDLSTNEVLEIRVARVAMWVLEMGTLGLIYWIARGFFTRFSSAMAVLAYISAGFVLLHGTSFRTDPIAVFLVMCALAVMLRGRLHLPGLGIVAITLSAALLVTVKVVFFAPALLAAALWRISESHKQLLLLIKFATAAIGMLAFSAILFLLHSHSLASADVTDATHTVSSAYQSTLLSSGLFPTGAFVLNGIMAAPIQTLLFLAGLVFAGLAVVRKDQHTKNAILFLLLASPLLSFAVYRNASPYFVAFIFPPAMLLVAFSVESLQPSRLIKLVLSLLMVLTCFHALIKRLPYDQTGQISVLSAVHDMFPNGTAYIDRNSMVPSFEKRGFFMSSWGLRSYHGRNQPLFQDLLQSETIPLVIANGPALEAALDPAMQAVGDRWQVLLPADVETLKRNYIRHWGPIWVAGRSLHADARGSQFSIDVPGYYTVESDRPVIIDGLVREDGATVDLTRGVHRMEADGPTDFVLRWGSDLFRPHKPAPASSLFPIF